MADLYPIVIIEDGYGGVYSGGKWFAIAKASEWVEGKERILSRAAYCLNEGSLGCDTGAREFWADPPPWIAAGETPGDALAALMAKAGQPSSI